MFINKIHLQYFKRFTDLTVDLSGLAAPPKLVLMIGANGSGKSSVFDAFESVSRVKSDDESLEKAFLRFRAGETKLYSYFQKTPDVFAIVKIDFLNKQPTLVSVTGDQPTPGQNPTANRRYADSTKMFYGRSALRQVPRLLRTSRQASEESIFENIDKPSSYIEADTRFENDLDVQTDRLLRDVFEGENYETQEIRDKYVKPINDALARIFTDEDSVNLRMYLLQPPLSGKPTNLRFRKGVSDLHYDLLSSGEKEVVNILFNLLTRRAFFDDTIYFIDELDVHLNTSLQYNLLKEITENWLPENCQLWTASHSLGFIQYASEAEHAAILDFDQLDFDQPHTLLPQPKDAREVYEIAVPAEMLPQLFRSRQIVLCENKNDELFNLIGLPDKVFVGVQNKRQVHLTVKSNRSYLGLMDRDYLAPSEISKIRNHYPNLFILTYYNFENYLYHPDNLTELVNSFDRQAYLDEIVRQKNAPRDGILMKLEMSRRSYTVLNDENLRSETGGDEIAAALRSDELETFYPYFDMKSRFDKKIIGHLNLSKPSLVQTNWFRSAITQIFIIEVQN
jgi:predicted ATPase